MPRRLHQSKVQLVERLDLTRVTLLCHDWGGAIGLGAGCGPVDLRAIVPGAKIASIIERGTMFGFLVDLFRGSAPAQISLDSRCRMLYIMTN